MPLKRYRQTCGGAVSVWQSGVDFGPRSWFFRLYNVGRGWRVTSG